MENNQNPDLDDTQVHLNQINEELKQKKEELIEEFKSPDTEESVSESGKEFGDVIGDLFYNSVKSFFEVGFKLAQSLNLDMFTTSKEEENKKENKPD